MDGAYAAWVTGWPSVVAYDRKLEPMKGKFVQVLQETKKGLDPGTGKESLRFGPMRVKVDGKEYECLEFKRCASKEELEAWRAAKRAPPPPPPQAPPLPGK